MYFSASRKFIVYKSCTKSIFDSSKSHTRDLNVMFLLRLTTTSRFKIPERNFGTPPHPSHNIFSADIFIFFLNFGNILFKFLKNFKPKFWYISPLTYKRPNQKIKPWAIYFDHGRCVFISSQTCTGHVFYPRAFKYLHHLYYYKN